MLNQLASFPGATFGRPLSEAKLGAGQGKVTCFDSPNVPPITLRDYLLRLWRYMNCTLAEISEDHADLETFNVVPTVCLR